MRLILALALALSAALYGQTTINGSRTILGNWDASGAASTKPAKAGTDAPATCAVGETFFDTDATAGSNWLLCTGTNTWTAVTGGGVGSAYGLADFKLSRGGASNEKSIIGASCSSASPCIYRVGHKTFRLESGAEATMSAGPASGTIYWYIATADGRLKAGHNSGFTLTCDADCDVETSVTGFVAGTVPIAAHTVTNNVAADPLGSMDHRAPYSINAIVAGDGIEKTVNGTTGQETVAADSSIQRVAADQSGASRRCVATSASATTYTCSMNPDLTAYTDGMVVEFEPDVDNSAGAVTLNIDSRGAIAVKACDGTTNPSAADLKAGRQIALRFEDAATDVFRLPCNPVTVSGGGVTPFNDTVVHIVHEFENNLFQGGVPASADGWFSGGIAWWRYNTTMNHPGTIEGDTTNTANSIAWTYLYSSYTPKWGLFKNLDSTINWEMQWIFKTPSTQTGGLAIRVGLIDSDPNTQTPGKGYWVRYNNNSGCTTTGSDATWIYEAKDAASSTGTGPSYAATTWYTLSIRSTVSGNIVFRMRTDGGSWSSDVTISEAANTPDEELTPFMHLINCSTVIRTITLDKWEVYATGLSR